MKNIKIPSDNLAGKIVSLDILFETFGFLAPVELICLMLTAKFYYKFISEEDELWRSLNTLYLGKTITNEKRWIYNWISFFNPSPSQYQYFKRSYPTIWNKSFDKISFSLFAKNDNPTEKILRRQTDERLNIIRLFVRSSIKSPAPLKINLKKQIVNLTQAEIYLLLQIAGTPSEPLLIALLQDDIFIKKLITLLENQKAYYYQLFLSKLNNYQFIDKILANINLKQQIESKIIKNLANHINPAAFDTLSNKTLLTLLVYTKDVSLLIYYYQSSHFDKRDFIPFNQYTYQDCCKILLNVSNNYFTVLHLLSVRTFIAKLSRHTDYLDVLDSLDIFIQGELLTEIIICLDKLGVRKNIEIPLLLSRFYEETYALLPASILEILQPYAKFEIQKQLIQQNISKQFFEKISEEDEQQQSWYFPSFGIK